MTTQQQAKLKAIEGDVLDALRSRLSDEEDDHSNDERIAEMDADKMLEEYCSWYGIPDFGWMVRAAIKLIDAAQTAGTSAGVQTGGNR